MVDLSDLTFGNYNATIVISDAFGNVVSDTVMVFVLPSTNTIPNTMDTVVIISIGVVLSGVIVIVILVRTKRIG